MQQLKKNDIYLKFDMFFSTGMRVNSENSFQDLGPILSKKFSFRFEVRASTDAYLGLSSGNSTKISGYWIVLGGWKNSKGCLRDGFVHGTTCFAEHYAFILKSAEYVKFWVTWNYGNIRVGIGETFNQGQIMQNNFHNVYDINNLLIKSFNKANWIVYL